MKVRICKILFSFLVITSINVTVAMADWNTVIQAEGENTGGVYQYEVTIGIGLAQTLSAPPAPPEYSVLMELYLPSDNSRLAKDIRSDGEASYLWIIGINPKGNSGSPFSDGTATISWNPELLGSGEFELRQGHDGTGSIVVVDMKDTTSYSVTGNDSMQPFSIVYVPGDDIQSDLNGDGELDINDLELLALNFGTTIGGNIADIDGNNAVDGIDLSTFAFDYNNR